MNPIEIGIKIAEAVRCRPNQKGKRYQICYGEGRIWCNPLGLLTQHHHVIAVFTEEDLRQGFTSQEWDQITRSIYKIVNLEKGDQENAETTENNNDHRGSEAATPNSA